MPVQPDTRRFAVVADLASYLSSAAFTALRGAPSGLATLGTDGTVPAAQLPIGLGGFYAAKAAATSRASTTTQTADPDLRLTLPAGLYRIETWLTFSGTGPAVRLTPDAGTATQQGDAFRLQASTVASITTMFGSAAGNQLGAGIGTAQYTGIVRLSAPAVLGLYWAQTSASTTATVLSAGSWIKAERISA
jgi:hypothetical protein